MSFINKLSSKVENVISGNWVKLPNRFHQESDWLNMGAVSLKPRTNTQDEILNSLKAHAKDNAEIADFLEHLDEMDNKYLGLAHDIVDLSRHNEGLGNSINMLDKANENHSFMGHILGMLPVVSRENPAALDLSQAVINNSDTINAKYFLINLFGFDLHKMSGLAEQFKAVKEVIPVIARDTLSGGYLMDFSKNKEFFEFVKFLASSDSKPANVRMLNEIMKVIQTLCKKTNPNCDLGAIKTADTVTLRKNLDALPYYIENAEAQGKYSVDISGFLSKAAD
ncbi:MAG: hypothetical protein VZR09_10645 [Candidatus Gastranaerophilaceae bacterium]|nr:hypothetical protein [Candidatus Gastranaerophilaceae bacterium]